jgi:general secretion pathway protein H
MPTSAIGNRLPRDAGVTLVEAMTALMIVGLMAGAVVMAAPGPDRKVRQEVERFAARAVLASEESIIANRTIALVVTHEGYGFERLEDNGWFPAEHRSPLGFRAWPNGLEARVEESTTAPSDPRVVRFDAVGNATPASIVMSGAGARWRVVVQGTGQVDVARAE